MVWSCFLIQFSILCLLIGALRPFSIWYQYWEVPVVSSHFYSPVVYFYLFLLYWTSWSKEFILSWIFLSHSSFFSVFKSPLSIFCSAGLVVVNSFSFSLLWKILLSLSIMKDNFAG
jgi:hypothetical protein